MFGVITLVECELVCNGRELGLRVHVFVARRRCVGAMTRCHELMGFEAVGFEVLT